MFLLFIENPWRLFFFFSNAEFETTIVVKGPMYCMKNTEKKVKATNRFDQFITLYKGTIYR